MRYLLFSSGLKNVLESNDLAYLKKTADALINAGYETRIRDMETLDYVVGYGMLPR